MGERLDGSASEVLRAGLGESFNNTKIAMTPTAISAAVPKNGARQDSAPSSPPSSGPEARPRPSAAS
nr:hypothetical protein [Baekduia alba]